LYITRWVTLLILVCYSRFLKIRWGFLFQSCLGSIEIFSLITYILFTGIVLSNFAIILNFKLIPFKLFFRNRKRLNHNIHILLLLAHLAFVTFRELIKNIITLLLIGRRIFLSETSNSIWRSAGLIRTFNWIIELRVALLVGFCWTRHHIWYF